VSKHYRPWAPEQSFLLPPSPMEWLPKGHLAYFVLDVVGELDLTAIEAAIHEKDPRGTRPYAPQLMTALIIYAYCTGVFSSRRIAQGTYEDVPLRVIGGGTHPHFTTINSFRLEHREALAGLFMQVLRLCQQAGLKTLGHVSLDGSKVPANASKHKAMSYGRMGKEEKRLEEEIRALLARADEVDAQEDAKYGSGGTGDDLPDELRHRETRLERIREAKAALEKAAAKTRAEALSDNAAELRAKADGYGLEPGERKAARTLATKAEDQAKKLREQPGPGPDDDDDDQRPPGPQLSLHRIQTTPDGRPKDKAQRNFTDADSRIMFRNGVALQAYNAQAVVSEDQIIVAYGLTNDPTDPAHLVPMLERVRENCGAFPAIVSADSGYLSEQNIDFCEANGIDAYVAVPKHEAERGPFPPTSNVARKRFDMQVKLAAPKARAIYALRKVIVEPVFGQIKGGMRFRRFSLRGLTKVPHEWGIVSLCHNLLKLFRRRAVLATA
jgi:transposase